MGKKKQRKKQRKMVKRMEKWIASESWTEDEFLAAGFAILAEAAGKKDKKRFRRSVKAGRTFREHFVGTDDLSEGEAHSEPVISYVPAGGGWYSVEVDGFEVDKLEGETAAAERAGELLAAYASADSAAADRAVAVSHTGGGWYQAIVNGVPVGRYRGKDAVPEHFAEFVPST